MSSNNINRGLDAIIADKRNNGSRNQRGGGGGDRRHDRQDFPRDGVKKSLRNDSRNLDSEWVHDRYEEGNSRRAPASRRRRDSPPQQTRGAKLRVENIHYDLTEQDLDELFRRIGPVTKLWLRYDRSGRSEGVAFVIYEDKEDALEAIKQFDGANANGQPIRLSLLSGGPPSRNPFDDAVMPGRPLSERISEPSKDRSRSLSPHPPRYNEEDAARKGIDRYVPSSGSRSRSPMPPRRGGGRRPGARREAERKDQENVRGGRVGSRGGRGTPRFKKTQEELDAEMEDYFSGNAPTTAEQSGQPAVAAAAAHAQADDVDMIE